VQQHQRHAAIDYESIGVGKMTNAIVLWTGGKDSFLALETVKTNGGSIRGLVTFAPLFAEFLAHPLPVLRLQAAALGLEHRICIVEEPYGPNYEQQLAEAAQYFGADTIVTGDIAEVEGYPNFIVGLCEGLGLRCERPLWHCNRNELLRRVLVSSADIVVSCVNTDILDEQWVGRRLDQIAFKELTSLAETQGFDECGEAGEYHTLVCDAPCFSQKIYIAEFMIQRRGTLAHMAGMRIDLSAKASAQ
jgi:uncharacterized protein (TIGR00290 family)